MNNKWLAITDFIKRLPVKWYIKKTAGLILIIWVIILPFFILIYTPTIIDGYLSLKQSALNFIPSNGDETAIKKMQKEAERLEKRLDASIPKGAYIVINTTTNTFKLYNKRVLVREGMCSTGSNVKLVKEDEREWMFKTPKGILKVQGKVTNPVWRKPDWAFIEEGLPVPSSGHSSRFEYGVLGDYALTLGDGYLIHGTLYQRFLGMPVTHGCIRLGDDDLEAVFRTLPVGSKVFIF